MISHSLLPNQTQYSRLFHRLMYGQLPQVHHRHTINPLRRLLPFSCNYIIPCSFAFPPDICYNWFVLLGRLQPYNRPWFALDVLFSQGVHFHLEPGIIRHVSLIVSVSIRYKISIYVCSPSCLRNPYNFHIPTPAFLVCYLSFRA